ncbi:hypothetical protein BG015_010644 [Linnemannia schmuckeri]|uniref:NACHT domain-containing protein n=1 Tax=Linnemannia schmuckeri TaxID=64567 RepID=A0A9P5RTQ6_9FUNG|nr:hypothetical protein BG015_010644 [Linnemannia schmuckeri]
MPEDPLTPHPVNVGLPGPLFSPLLIRVQVIPDVEHELHRLRAQRMKERENFLYIPPQARPTLQSCEDTLFPLMEKAQEFLAGPWQVLLLLGDSGAGKSTFNLQLEHTLWKEYKKGGPIPLYINFPAIDNPYKNMIDKQLQQLHLFSDSQIQELRQSRELIVICDGYDESQLKKNLYTTNQFNKPGQWKVKLVISCRTQYLGSDYRSQFQPTVDRYAKAAPNLFQEAVIAPFSRRQIAEYVKQYVQRKSSHVDASEHPEWDAYDYLIRLVEIPNLIDLVSNPFLLTLALRALPRVACSEKDLSVTGLTRIGLYDSFTEEWLENSKRRLEDGTLSLEAQSTFDILRDEGFVPLGVSFQKDLAAAIFQHQNGAAVFRFLHRSILEYLYPRVIFDPFDPDSATSQSSKSFVGHSLNQRSIVKEPSILRFLADRAVMDNAFKAQLFAIIEDSKSDVLVSQAAANAISILIRAGVRFNGADLRGIKIPGADFRGGEFDSANLRGANLSGVNLSKTWLRQANLIQAQMTGVQLGELPYIKLESAISRCVFSSDGNLLAVSTKESGISIYYTATWTRIGQYPGGKVIAISPTTRELAKSNRETNTVELGDILIGRVRLILVGHHDKVTSIAYSPDGTLIATASKDTTIRIWSTLLGNALYLLIGHSETVKSVAFSPTGTQLASCSKDETARIWDSLTGELDFVLKDQASGVTAVAYSPDGSQIASGSSEGTVQLWDAHTGENIQCLNGNVGTAESLAYSPDGRQLASGDDATGSIRLWDCHSGQLLNTLTGHHYAVTSIAYSPTGDYIASSSYDSTVRLWRAGGALSDGFSNGTTEKRSSAFSPNGEQVATGGQDCTVRLWETSTGKLMITLIGHSENILAVAFSPCGQRIASSSADCTIRLWCNRTGGLEHVFEGPVGKVDFSPCGLQIVSACRDRTVRTWNIRTREPGITLNGHTDMVNGAVYSPSGHQIASCSHDKTVRLWCAQTGVQLFVLEHPMFVHQVIYSASGQELLSASFDGTLRCWNPQSAEPIHLQGKVSEWLTCCCFSPDEKLVATVNVAGFLQLWDRCLGKWLKILETVIGQALAIGWVQGRNVSYLSSRSHDEIRVWKLVENDDGSFALQLLWNLGKTEFSLMFADLTFAVGLTRSDIKLVMQRGGRIIVEDDDEYDDEDDDKYDDENDDEEEDEEEDKDEDKPTVNLAHEE